MKKRPARPIAETFMGCKVKRDSPARLAIWEDRPVVDDPEPSLPRSFATARSVFVPTAVHRRRG